jgi:hypothetical protein
LMTESMMLTLGSSNSMIWKTKVSLNSGSIIFRRVEVLHFDNCWPIELNIATLTYVSGGKKGTKVEIWAERLTCLWMHGKL